MTNEELARLIRAGNEELHPVLWQKVNKLLYAKAAAFYNNHTDTCARCGVELSDIRQECYAVYLEAVKAYKPELDTKFISYVEYPFKNAVNALLGLRTERQKNEPLNNCKSLDKPIEIADGDACTLLDIVQDEGSTDFLEDVDRDSEAAFIRQIVAEMKEPYRTVIRLHFFEERTLQVIGQELGVSIERARQYKYKALRKLRQNGQLRQIYTEQKRHDNWLQVMQWEHSPERFALVQQLRERDLSYGCYQAELYAARERWIRTQEEPQKGYMVQGIGMVCDQYGAD